MNNMGNLQEIGLRREIRPEVRHHASITDRMTRLRPGRRDMLRKRLRFDLHETRGVKRGGLRVSRPGSQARGVESCGFVWLEPVTLMLRGIWNGSGKRKRGSRGCGARRMGI